MGVGSPSVIVVGAGPAGATLAYLLASRGIKVTLLERQRNFEREFRGEVLLPSGVEALTQMGLSRIFAEVPQVEPARIELYADGKPVFQLPIDPSFVGPNRPVAFSQPAFLEAVIGASSNYPGYEVRLGASVRGLLRDDKRVIGVRVAGRDGESELHADLVIGADGLVQGPAARLPEGQRPGARLHRERAPADRLPGARRAAPDRLGDPQGDLRRAARPRSGGVGRRDREPRDPGPGGASAQAQPGAHASLPALGRVRSGGALVRAGRAADR